MHGRKKITSPTQLHPWGRRGFRGKLKSNFMVSKPANSHLGGGLNQPFWKNMLVKLDHKTPRIRVKTKNVSNHHLVFWVLQISPSQKDKLKNTWKYMTWFESHKSVIWAPNCQECPPRLFFWKEQRERERTEIPFGKLTHSNGICPFSIGNASSIPVHFPAMLVYWRVSELHG